MIRRISLAERRSITRAVYEKHGYHVEHFYPYTAIPICPVRTRLEVADKREVQKAAAAAIAEAERLNGYEGKRRWRGGGPR